MKIEELHVCAVAGGLNAIEVAWIDITSQNAAGKYKYLKSVAISRYGYQVMQTLVKDRKKLVYVKANGRECHGIAGKMLVYSKEEYGNLGKPLTIDQRAVNVLRFPQYVVFLCFRHAEYVAQHGGVASPISLESLQAHPKYSRKQVSKMVRAGIIEHPYGGKAYTKQKSVEPSAALKRLIDLTYVATRGYVQAYMLKGPLRVQSYAPAPFNDNKFDKIHRNITNWLGKRIADVISMKVGGYDTATIRKYIAECQKADGLPWAKERRNKNKELVIAAISEKGMTIKQICDATGLKRTGVNRVLFGRGTATHPIGGIYGKQVRMSQPENTCEELQSVFSSETSDGDIIPPT